MICGDFSSDTAVMTTSISMARTSPHSSPAEQISHSRKTSPGRRLSPIQRTRRKNSPLKRPSTAPNINPFGTDRLSHQRIRFPGRLSVGLVLHLSTANAAVDAMKKKVMDRQRRNQSELEVTAKKLMYDLLLRPAMTRVLSYCSWKLRIWTKNC